MFILINCIVLFIFFIGYKTSKIIDAYSHESITATVISNSECIKNQSLLYDNIDCKLFIEYKIDNIKYNNIITTSNDNTIYNSTTDPVINNVSKTINIRYRKTNPLDIVYADNPIHNSLIPHFFYILGIVLILFVYSYIIYIYVLKKK